MSKVVAHWGLLLAVTVSATAYTALLVVDQRHGTLRAEHVPTSITWYLVAFAGFGLAVWWNEQRGIDWRLLWLIPIGFRLAMLATEPTLSDDVYRYLWDGHLLSEGVNPYAYAINAGELDPYEIPARRLANNPDLSSPYLPAAHGVFGLAGTLLPSNPLTMQVIMTGFDLGAAALIVRLLRLAELPAARVMLYLWNPLVIIETAHAAHLDALMIFLTIAAFGLTFREPAPHRLSPVVMALAVLTRPIPLLLVPLLFWRWRWPERLTFAGVLLAVIVPFGFGPAGFGLFDAPIGRGVFGSARVYAQEFRFNAGPARWLEDLFGAAGASVAVTATTAAIGLLTLAMARNADSPRALLRLGALPLAGYVLLTPVLHPWYLTLLVALMVFVAPGSSEGNDRWLLLVPWAYLAATAPLSYLTYRDPLAFGELEWVRRVEWFPTITLLVFTSFWVFFAVQAEHDPPDRQLSAGSGNR